MQHLYIYDIYIYNVFPTNNGIFPIAMDVFLTNCGLASSRGVSLAAQGVSLAKRQAGGCAMDIGLGFVGFTILPIKNGDFP